MGKSGAVLSDLPLTTPKGQGVQPVTPTSFLFRVNAPSPIQACPDAPVPRLPVELAALAAQQSSDPLQIPTWRTRTQHAAK